MPRIKLSLYVGHVTIFSWMRGWTSQAWAPDRRSTCAHIMQYASVKHDDHLSVSGHHRSGLASDALLRPALPERADRLTVCCIRDLTAASSAILISLAVSSTHNCSCCETLQLTLAQCCTWVLFLLTQSNPIHSNPILKYSVLNRTRKPCYTNYSNADC